MIVWPAPHIHFAWVDDDLVALDVRTDAYSVVIGARAEAAPTPDGGLDARQSFLEALTEAGWVGSSPRPSSPRSPSTALAAPPSAFRLVDLTSVLSLHHKARRHLHRRPFESLIAEPVPGRSPTPGDLETLAALTGVFRTHQTYALDTGLCLQRAFTLRRWLSRHGFRLDWCFGVRTWPFEAHCWLQAGDVVVGDDLDRVRRHVPIMRV